MPELTQPEPTDERDASRSLLEWMQLHFTVFVREHGFPLGI